MDQEAAKKPSEVKINLILDHTFWGIIALDLKYREIRPGEFPPGFMPTMGVNGTEILYSPDFVKKLPKGQLKGVLLHEFLHLIFDHLGRRIGKEPLKWQLATDFVVNAIVKKQSGFELPNNVLFSSKYDDWTAEEVYADLTDKDVGNFFCPTCSGQGSVPDEKQQQGKGDQEGDGDKQEEGNGGGQEDNKDEHGNGGTKPCPDCKGHSKYFMDWHGYSSTEQSKEFIEKVINAYDQLTPEQRQQGLVPAEVSRLIAELKNPKIDYRELIRATVMDRFMRKDYSYSAYNRSTAYSWVPDEGIYTGEPIYLPILTGEKNKTLVVAVDTSGSIGPHELQLASEELQGVIPLADRTIVMSCDAQVHTVNELNEFSDILKEVSLRGGGGTSFIPVFEKIEEDKIQCDALIYITDGYGSFPSIEPDYPVVWIVLPNTLDPSQFPFGQVAVLKD